MTAHSPLLIAAASLFSAETQDVSPFTSPGNTQIRAEEPKPPVSETPWTISDRCDPSADVADSADDPAAFKRAQKHGRVSSPLSRDLGPLQHDYDKNQHDPIIDDTSHVDLTLVPARGTPRSPSPRPDPSGRKPTLPKILTNTQLESSNSDSPRTFYTPNGGDEVVDRKPFNSAVNIQVVYSESSSRSRNLASGPGRGVVEVRQPVDKWGSKYPFPTQALQLPRSNSRTAEDTPRDELRMPSQVTRGGRDDSTFSFSSSPSELRRDVGPSRCISEVNISTILGWESGSRPKSKLSAGDEGDDIQCSKNTTLPRQKEERMIQRWDGDEGGSGEGHREKEKERDDPSVETDYVSVPNEVEERPRSKALTPVSLARSAMRYAA